MPPLPNNTTPSTKHHENSSSDNKKTTKLPAPEHGVKCPRCDSPNTKFCYYNNYSLTQPRHFCKTCRRYWTNGGALRNVPIGGGCRKNKKVKTSTFSSSAWDSITKDSSSAAVSSLAGLRFFNNSPSLEFQLGGGLPLFPATRVHHTHHQHQQQQQQSSFSNGYNQFSTIGGLSNVSSLQLDPSGNLNYPFCSSTSGSGINGASVTAMGSTIQGMNSMNVNTSLASSIESLSSINQDLHLKLQQQRLATMYGGDNINININQKEGSSSVSVSESQVQFENENHTLKPQPLLFQNLEISKPEMFQNGNYRKEGSGGDAPVEWFFGNSNYSSVTPASATTTNGLDNGNNNWSGGVHAWSDVQQPYNALP